MRIYGYPVSYQIIYIDASHSTRDRLSSSTDRTFRYIYFFSGCLDHHLLSYISPREIYETRCKKIKKPQNELSFLLSKIGWIFLIFSL
jgi:hypothetical protein